MPIPFADAIFWLGVASCAVAQVAILRSVLRVRRGAGMAAGVPRPRSGMELAWAVVPAIALALLLAATWRTMHPRSERPEPSASSRVSSRTSRSVAPRSPGTGSVAHGRSMRAS